MSQNYGNNEFILFNLRERCVVCPKNQKEVCMAVKKQAETKQGLIWIPKCQWDTLKQLDSFTSLTAK
jgi:formylmethanofuran dehydrogenase subunit D